MSELAAACNLSLSGMTRAVTRLEKQGWGERAKWAQDGRGWNAVLTEAGLARLEQAWPAFLVGVRRHFVGHFGGQDPTELTATFRRVATAGDGPG